MARRRLTDEIFLDIATVSVFEHVEFDVVALLVCHFSREGDVAAKMCLPRRQAISIPESFDREYLISQEGAMNRKLHYTKRPRAHTTEQLEHTIGATLGQNKIPQNHNSLKHTLKLRKEDRRHDVCFHETLNLSAAEWTPLA